MHRKMDGLYAWSVKHTDHQELTIAGFAEDVLKEWITTVRGMFYLIIPIK